MACVALTEGVLRVGSCFQHQRSAALKCNLLCKSFKSALCCQTQYHMVLPSERGVAGFHTLLSQNGVLLSCNTWAITSAAQQCPLLLALLALLRHLLSAQACHTANMSHTCLHCDAALWHEGAVW